MEEDYWNGVEQLPLIMAAFIVHGGEDSGWELDLLSGVGEPADVITV